MRPFRIAFVSACFLMLTAAGVRAAPSEPEEGPRTVPLRNVTVVDRTGAQFELTGFYHVSGEDRFVGFLGASEIEVPYARVRELRVQAPLHPGGRPRAALTLRSGEVVKATFDQREAEQLFTGYAAYGRVSIFFRDIRRLVLRGNTSRDDLPRYGKPAEGVDVKVTDREGVATEIVRFRRVSVENVIPGVRGAASIAMPLRILERVVFTLPTKPTDPHLVGTAHVRSGGKVTFRLPTYEEQSLYRGDATFGILRIRLGKIRELVIHRVSPPLRRLDPVEAARGRPKPEVDPPR